jgi:MHS family proline/betaine transporter-like MFS transporter
MSKKRVIISSGIANTFEWYDYALFGNFASLIGQKFFPETDSESAILNAFMVFAIGYLMRPLGGIFFGVVGDKFGRKTALSLSVICMSIPTAIIGILPTYEEIGSAASILMALMRMIQGLSMGGALTGSISFLIEHTSKKHRGLVGSIPMAGICVGILLGTVVSLVIRSIMSDYDFNSWGWRIPFLLGIFIMFAGFYIVKHTEETPMYKQIQESGKVESAPIRTVFKNHLFDMIVSVMINSTGSVIFYFQAVYVSNFLKVHRGLSESFVDKLSAASYIIMAISCLLFGAVSDLIGKRRTLAGVVMAAILTTFAITYNIEFGSIGSVVFYQILLGIVAAAYISPEPALQAEFYPTKIRATALSISYNFSTSIFGGTTPLAITYIYNKTGSLSSCSVYIIITSLFSLVGLYFYKNRCTEVIER